MAVRALSLLEPGMMHGFCLVLEIGSFNPHLSVAVCVVANDFTLPRSLGGVNRA